MDTIAIQELDERIARLGFELIGTQIELIYEIVDADFLCVIWVRFILPFMIPKPPDCAANKRAPATLLTVLVILPRRVTPEK
ncbi:hypothetical protein M5X06_08905 [Paenibacillus alvei]|uniref:Uncharacterized protein n=1 Tax=Paenibacillus alvei TaxID=44250 RepID=A0ABT4H6S7_PAEAL|nr:hypothetical protein [Paenibacillus alvei]MCY9766951.1 hypothetical protein [Paenibacillus alvei]